jgi:hypothetical protein
LAECAALTFLASAIYSPAWAITQNEIQKLLASDGSARHSFGWSVAVDGDTAVIGARGDDYNGDLTGSAYVFTRSAGSVWTEQQKLTASDGARLDQFGMTVALDGDTTVLGARGNGTTYVFTRSKWGVWRERQKLNAFGSIALSGDTIVIGDSGDDENGASSGAAYVFIRGKGGNWSEQQKLTASDGAVWDQFGGSVALSGDTIVIGAANDDDNGESSGSAYVFTRSAGGVWTEQQKLTASDGASEDAFGSVALDGNIAVIGASRDDDNGWRSGSAYVFTRSAGGVWTEQQKLTASDGERLDFFGESVAVDGVTVVIGAWGNDDDGSESGSAYMFTRNAGGVWTEQQKLIASDAEWSDRFGESVTVDGGTAIIGARGEGDGGSAYVFMLGTNVHIDIKPGNKRNKINPRSRGRIWVAILSNTDNASPFDPASQVDIPTVEFGPDGATANRYKLKDINKDGLGDLLLRFKIRKTGIACRDTEATLTGKTFDGLSFTGTDSIRTVGCKPKKCHNKKHYNDNYHDDKRHQGN